MKGAKGVPSEDGSSVFLNCCNPSFLTLGSDLCLTIAGWYDPVTGSFLLTGHVTVKRGWPATGELMWPLFHCCLPLPFLFLVSNGSLWSPTVIRYTVTSLLRTTSSIFVFTLKSFLLCLMKAVYLFHHNLSLVFKANHIAQIVNILINNLWRKITAMLWSQATPRFCLQCKSYQNLDDVGS